MPVKSFLHTYEQLAVAVCEIMPVSAVVPVFTAGTYGHCRGTTTVLVLLRALPRQYFWHDRTFLLVVAVAIPRSHKG